MRLRVILDVEHPDATQDELADWLQEAHDELELRWQGLSIVVDELERMDQE